MLGVQTPLRKSQVSIEISVDPHFTRKKVGPPPPPLENVVPQLESLRIIVFLLKKLGKRVFLSAEPGHS